MAHPVTINVGGRLFTTLPETLLRIPYFAARAEFNRSAGRENEPVFLDLDPDAFAAILEFCRHGSVVGLTRRKHRPTLNFLGFEWKELRRSARPNSASVAKPFLEHENAVSRLAIDGEPLDLCPGDSDEDVFFVKHIFVCPSAATPLKSLRFHFNFPTAGWSFRGDGLEPVSRGAWRIPFPMRGSLPCSVDPRHYLTITGSKEPIPLFVICEHRRDLRNRSTTMIVSRPIVTENGKSVAEFQDLPTQCSHLILHSVVTLSIKGNRLPRAVRFEVDKTISDSGEVVKRLFAGASKEFLSKTRGKGLYTFDMLDDCILYSSSFIGMRFVFDDPNDAEEVFLVLRHGLHCRCPA